mgnify:CR=1 FL=1
MKLMRTLLAGEGEPVCPGVGEGDVDGSGEIEGEGDSPGVGEEVGVAIPVRVRKKTGWRAPKRNGFLLSCRAESRHL